MSAVAAESEPTRYEGLIRTAQELFDAHEESGWRLANVIYDAVQELRNQGLVVRDSRDSKRMTATKRIALDMDRYRMGAQTVSFYYRLWRRFGAPARRLDALTFNDHLELTRTKPGPTTAKAASALKRYRDAVNAGKKPEFGSAIAAVAASRGGKAAGHERDALRRISLAKSNLRGVLKTDVWDYPDHQKVAEHRAEIRDLLDQVDAKPWGPEGAAADDSARDSSNESQPTLADQIKRVLDAHAHWRIDGSHVLCTCGADLDVALAPDDALRTHVAAVLVAAKPWNATDEERAS